MNETAAPKKIKFLTAVILIPFFSLIFFFFFMQVVSGGKYRRLANNNSIRLIPLKAKRGVICDRNGEILADSVPALYAAFVPEELKGKDDEISILGEILFLKKEDIESEINSTQHRNSFEPVKVKELNNKDLARLAGRLLEVPGVFIKEEPKRYYPYKKSAAHILGYLGEIDEKELKSPVFLGYKRKDLIGQSGIEKILEKQLKGKDGGKQILVDALGRYIKELGSKSPYPGRRIYLTIDQNIQAKAEQALGKNAGAIIVSKVKTGEILAMVSQPSFNPNIFVNPLSQKKLKKLYSQPHSPFLNRVIQSAYPPGSIFKIVTAAAILDKNLISTRKELNCFGEYELGGKIFHCWKKEGHGPVDFLSALEQSCNLYFFQLAEKLDVDDLYSYGRQFGLGRKTGLNLHGERKGNLPCRKWKKEKYQSEWYQGETLNLSIGQGYITTTPIQILNLISCLANEGQTYQPRLIVRITTPEGKLIKSFKSKLLHTVDFDEKVWRFLKEGLRRVVNGKNGTGRAARLENITVAGKTGTAQVIKKKIYEKSKKEDIPYRFRNHAWFAGFAPYSDPEVAIVIFIEHGGQGGVDAAPIAREILEQFFKEEKEDRV